jgi:hypothetical protein
MCCRVYVLWCVCVVVCVSLLCLSVWVVVSLCFVHVRACLHVSCRLSALGMSCRVSASGVMCCGVCGWPVSYRLVSSRLLRPCLALSLVCVCVCVCVCRVSRMEGMQGPFLIRLFKGLASRVKGLQ